ncbi:MAG: hypothetical protein ACOYOP_09990 [Microthrixaceae bacterium]
MTQAEPLRAVVVPRGATAVLDAPPLAVAPPAWTVRLPRPTDPRLHVAACLLTVQVLGQVAIGFELSIAQILVALGTAGLIEAIVTARRERAIAWPASALLTGNGVALILRVPGTEHGDWWSMRGWYVFAATAALAVLSKYAIRAGGRPLFNPSNLALVAAFVILGPGIADPQDLWWGPWSVGLALTYLVILGGGLAITRRLHLLRVSAAFWGVFAVLMAALALSGHAMSARWHLGPVEGFEYWTTLTLSPEILIFLFFMITDPRTAARGRSASVLYAGAVAAASAVLVSFQHTEYATKVALLAGLVLVCAGRPLLERWAPADDDPGPARWLRSDGRRPVLFGVAALLVVGVTVSAGAWVGPPATAADAGRRPALQLRADQVPDRVTMGADARSVGGALDMAAARDLAAEAVVDLVLADRAAATGDRELAGTVASGPWYRELTARPPTPAPERTVRSAHVDVVRDLADFQATPRLSVELTGTLDGAPWSETFHLVRGDRAYLIEKAVPAG